MTSLRAPALHRLSQVLQALGIVALVGLILFLATAAYSAAQLRPELGGTNGSGSAVLNANGSAVLRDSVNVSNPGFYEVSPLTVSLQLRNVSGSLLGTGGSLPLTIGAGSHTQIPFSIWVPLSGSAASLVTHDATLPLRVWLNATYASTFVLHLSATSNYPWGAPFYNFTATPGSPTLQPNGSVRVPVAIAFENHASFADVGIIQFTVRSASGAACTSGSIGVNVPGGSSMSQAYDFYATSSCNPSGGTIESSYSGGGLTVALPTEPIP